MGRKDSLGLLYNHSSGGNGTCGDGGSMVLHPGPADGAALDPAALSVPAFLASRLQVAAPREIQASDTQGPAAPWLSRIGGQDFSPQLVGLEKGPNFGQPSPFSENLGVPGA